MTDFNHIHLLEELLLLHKKDLETMESIKKLSEQVIELVDIVDRQGTRIRDLEFDVNRIRDKDVH